MHSSSKNLDSIDLILINPDSMHALSLPWNTFTYNLSPNTRFIARVGGLSSSATDRLKETISFKKIQSRTIEVENNFVLL